MTDDVRQLAAALDGTYVLGGEIGGGGMARVFAATECALGRPVVLKVLSTEFDTRAALGRFRREVRVAASFQHPHIVPLLHAGVAGGLLYYTMPMVAGESLRARLARDGPFDLARGASVLHDVAEALAYAHARGVVHRDVKPGNVMLAGDDALVIDFGIATAIAAVDAEGHADASEHTADLTRSQLTDAAVVIGSPGYVSPEQAAGDPVDHRTDLYALGCVAYEIFAGTPPFTGPSARALLAAHIVATPEPLAQRRPDLPDELAALVTRCLAKDRNARPQSAAELLPTLARFRVATSAPEHPPATLAPAVPATHVAPIARAAGRRRPWPTRPLLVAGFALFASVAVVAAVRAHEHTTRAAPVADAPAIAVVPFTVLAHDPSLAFLGDGMVALLAARLGGMSRVADPAAGLAAWRAAARDTARGASRARVASAARSLGVRQVVTGEVVGTGRHLVLSASLLDVPSGREQRASAEGSLDSLPVVADRLSNALVALAAGEGPERAALVADEPQAPLREYLIGRALQRRSMADSANRHFLAAVQLDSTFAEAALQLATTAIGTRNRLFHVDALALAWRHRERLGVGDRAIAEARGAAFPPFGDPSAELVRLSERAVDVVPGDAEAWRWFGAVLYRFGAAAEAPNADARAAAAFERAAALDSVAMAGNTMRAAVHAVRGDSAAVRRAVRAGLATDSASEEQVLHAWLAGVLLGDSVQRARARRHFTAAEADRVHRVVSLATDLGVGLDDADSVIRVMTRSAATPDERMGAVMFARQLYLGRGQPARAAQAYAALSPVHGGDERSHPAENAALDATFGDGDAALGVEARHVLGLAFAAGVPPDSVVRTRVVAALYDIAHGDPRTARRVLAEWHERRRAPPGPARVAGAATPNAGPTVRDLLVASLDAWLAVEDRRPDARTLVARLDSLARAAPPYQVEVPNLVASDLWARLGDVPHALAASRRRTRWLFSSQYLAPFLRREGRLAAANGDTAGAVRAYRHYVRLRADAEPVLRADLGAVRGQLARLERGAGGR